VKSTHQLSPPEWTLEIEKELRRLRISKRELAKMLNLNYAAVCNASTGYINRPDIVHLIQEKIKELKG